MINAILIIIRNQKVISLCAMLINIVLKDEKYITEKISNNGYKFWKKKNYLFLLR